jgi:spore coat polysaccharide biosynthesis protein SpsF
MASSRLPGKVLLDIEGATMLERVVDRTGYSKWVDRVVVATSVDPSDNPIEALCAGRGYSSYRGSTGDVLDRYYQAARMYQADVVVRITADCPLIDAGVIDQTIEAFFDNRVLEQNLDERLDASRYPWDFAANRLPPPWKRTYPIGLDTEVCTFQALERAWKEAREPHQREHVMPYLYEQAGRFRVLQIDHDPDYGALRWTVDTAEDLELVRRIYEHFGGRDEFSWKEVLAIFQDHPELQTINAGVKHKSVHDVDTRD